MIQDEVINTEKEKDDLYNFHEAVSLLMESEEQVIDEHKSSMEVKKYFWFTAQTKCPKTKHVRILIFISLSLEAHCIPWNSVMHLIRNSIV